MFLFYQKAIKQNLDNQFLLKEIHIKYMLYYIEFS